MSNEAALNSPSVPESNSSPPPYSSSDEFPSVHPTRLPENLNLSGLTEEPTQEIPKVSIYIKSFFFLGYFKADSVT